MSPILAAAQRLRTSAILLDIVCVVIAGMTSCARLGPPGGRRSPRSGSATVMRVVDGDTIDVRGDARGRLRIRLLGIDTPEVHGQDGQWAAGARSSPFATETLAEQRVTLAADPTQDPHDRYRRSLAYIELADGRDFYIEAARDGISRSYVSDDQPVSRYPEIKAAEEDARGAHRGFELALQRPHRIHANLTRTEQSPDN